MSKDQRDKLALTDDERSRLNAAVTEARRLADSGPERLTVVDRLLVRAAEHIGVLEQRIENLSYEYRRTDAERDRLRERIGALRDSARLAVESVDDGKSIGEGALARVVLADLEAIVGGI